MLDVGVIALALGAVVLGCSKAELPRGLGDTAVIAPLQSGVCGLLAPEELEIVLNAPLQSGAETSEAAGGTGLLERPLLPRMRMCTASASSGRARVSWGVLNDDGESAFERYERWHDDYVTGVRVGRHEGVWDARLRTLVVLAGEQVFGIQVTVPNPPGGTDSEEDRAAYVREQARALAVRALERL